MGTIFPKEEAKHTFVVSDIHLTPEEPVHPKDPLWRKFKQKEFFIDDLFERFLKQIQKEITEPGPIELILAGDIFDFDGTTDIPKEANPAFPISWLEKRRGLNTEEPKSLFKMRKIIEDHPVFFQALDDFLKNGHRVVFIIGNHDLEMHWPSMQRLFCQAIGMDESSKDRVIFNNWFYISNRDTIIEHGNQHDSHSNCQNPIYPFIKGHEGRRIRIPFGCSAHRLLLNGMGFFNPHSERNYLMSTTEYLSFYFKHLLRREPFLAFTWLWSAWMTMFMTLKEGLAREWKDPLRIDEHVEDIARKANATPRIVRVLKEIHAPPMFMDPLSLARELWVDRAFLLFFGAFLAFELASFLNLLWNVRIWMAFVIFGFFVPFFIYYSRSVKSTLAMEVENYEEPVIVTAQATGVKRVIFGHTHKFVHTNFQSVEYLNSGTWSPAFDDIECTKPSCPKTFVWIRPEISEEGVEKERIANVYEWTVSAEYRLLC